MTDLPAAIPALAWWLAIFPLTAFRLTVLLTRDSFPPAVWLRDTVQQKWSTKWWAPLVDCPWCSGFWISVGVTLLGTSPVASIFQWVALPLAMSAVAGLLADLGEE